MKKRFRRTCVNNQQTNSVGSIKRAWNFAKRWGRNLLVTGLMTGTTAGVTSCSDTQQEQIKPIGDTGIWAKPYKGEILQDENGNYYMAHRFVMKFKDSVNQDFVENLTKEFGGKVTGHIPQINAFEIEVSGDIDVAITAVSKKESVEIAARNYYSKTARNDNDAYIKNGTKPSITHGDETTHLEDLSDEEYESFKYLEKGLWWSNKIELSAALGLLESSEVELTPTTIAVMDVGFDVGDANDETDNDIDIPYVSSKHHWDFSDWDQDVNSANVHGNQVSAFVSAINNGEKTNGVASATNDGEQVFSILPLKIYTIPTERDTPNNFLDEVIEINLKRLFGDDFRLAASLAYVSEKANELNIRAVNMSLEYLLFVETGLSITQGAVIFHIRISLLQRQQEMVGLFQLS